MTIARYSVLVDTIQDGKKMKAADDWLNSFK